jgi:hypothetical protein
MINLIMLEGFWRTEEDLELRQFIPIVERIMRTGRPDSRKETGSGKQVTNEGMTPGGKNADRD